MFEKYRKSNNKLVKIDTRNGEYGVTEDGQVFDFNNGFIGYGYNHKGEKTVRLDLGFGYKTYTVAVLVLLGYSKLKLPHDYLDQVEPFYLDADVTNLHPSNIGYRYKQPIECVKYQGFYYIPFFNTYAVNKAGVVINTHTGGLPKTYISKPKGANPKNIRGGYVNYTLPSDVGPSTIGRHRILALTFRQYPNHVDKLDVNHINGVPGDDRLDNLEWSTRKHNNLHAVMSGLRSQNIVCYAKNVFSGEEVEFFSLSDAARRLNSDSASMTARIREGKQKLYTGGWMFKTLKAEPWRVVDNPWKELQTLSTPTKVKAKNIFTGEITSHESIAQIGSDLNLEYKNGPQNQILSGRDRPYYGYVFRVEGDTTPWPEFTERELLLYKDNPSNRARGVIATKIDDGTELFFTNLAKAREHFSDKLKRVHDVCKAIDRNRKLDGYTLSYFEPPVRSSSDR